ncbi:MAG TPA: ParB/RepB/Spo0J family partition protein [Candidatus Sulfotelmatobacter sp.]|nr:ParB/RepB/Spo0J family partition protein [Candidatus Sulfotelmatobacter sp.]
MNNTAAAGKVVGQAADKDKDKVEKRRALGRGLASLLPGPRVVAPTAPASAPGNQNPQPFDELRAGSVAHGAAPHQPVPTFRSSAGEQQVPHFVRNDNTVRDDNTAGIDEPLTIQAQAEPSRVPGNLVINVAISDIDKNPFQTRYVQDDDALEELSESIKASGVVQPIVVRPSEEDETRYVLVLGERRLHASKKAGKTHIPALVRKVSLQQAAEMTIVENLQREDLSPLEQAEAFRVLSNQFQLTQEQIGARVGLSRVSVANYMRLLKLPREVMEMLANKTINFAKAKELLKLEGNDRIAEAALYAVKKGMNLEQVEMLVLRMDGLLDPLPDMPGVVREKKSSGARWVDPNVKAAQLDLERMLGVRVRIRDRKGRGKIVIEYSTVDDYDRVVEMLRGKK